MTTAVVILNWNGAALLREFLPSVVNAVQASEAVLVVADNGSTDDSLALLAAEFPSVTVCPLDQNYGFAEGYNRALAWVRDTLGSEVYVLLNSDVFTPEGFLSPLLRRLETDQACGVVCPKLRAYKEPSRFEYAGAAGGRLSALGYPYCRGRVLHRTEVDRGQYDTPAQVDWATGACLAIRAALYWEMGGFEGRFFAHMEEIDLCWRIRRAGYTIYCEPSSVVYHLGGGSLSNQSPRKVYLNFRNNRLMLRRNLPPGLRKFLILSLRFWLDGAVAALYLCTGRWRFFKAVLAAHRDYWRMRGDMGYVKPQREERG